jgi:GNAT superfamily N-acetyltransferase
VTATVATPADAAAVSDTLARAFYDDPTWSWAFPDPERRLEQQRAWWGLFVDAAIPHGGVWMTEGCGAAAIWIPPGVPELNEEQEARSEVLLRELIGDRADEVRELQAEFGANHPIEPHSYLSLLGTHPDRWGRGEGMGLLAENLERIDAEGAAAYLESSNRENDRRYERLGFELVGEFSGPSGEPVVGRMWREPR